MLFHLQVGCGAIGCEMLKNFALLGVGLAQSSGEVVISCYLTFIILIHVFQYISTLGEKCTESVMLLSILRCASQIQTL